MSERVHEKEWRWAQRVGCVLAIALAAGPARAEETGLSPTRLSLPRGPGSLEGVGENADIDVNMGLMSYAVPIAAPSGHGGASPGLALRYSSGAGSSVAGMGWSLSVPSIERTSVRGLPLYDREDTFAADGSQELVRLSPTGAVYRARFEQGFVRYTWLAAGDGSGGYWRAEYPDGRVGTFGGDASGAIDEGARVSGPRGVFRWHLVEMRDVHGHAVRYSYVKDGATSLLSRVSYVGSRYAIELAYEARPDELSDARPGFELRMTRRLREIRVRVRGVQLRRYALSYDDLARSGGLSRLSRVTQHGVGDAGPYPVQFSFRYGPARPEDCASIECAPYVQAMGSVGADLGAGAADFLDLNGDSLPDLVDTSGATHVIHANALGPSSHGFEIPTSSRVADGGAAQLASSAVQLCDLNGDGFTDLIDGANQRVLYNRGEAGGDWSEEASIADLGLPDFQADSSLRFFDYDGDGRIDVMHAGTDETFFYRNDGDSFAATATLGEPIGVGASEGLRLADMNGDGLLDAVTIAPGVVRYRLYLGHGRWAAWAEMTGAPLEHPPLGFELVDLNGDALADLVSVEADELRYALNRNGRDLDALRSVTDVPLPVRTVSTAVRFLDMNGSGSTDVVWISAGGDVQYLELFPVRPHLLASIENGLGRRIEVTYGSSAAHMGRDGGAMAWRWRLPNAMITVDRIAERDGVSSAPEVREYAYHHGFWDGVERQFRGFEEVEVRTLGDASSEEGEERYEFDVGADDTYRKGKLLRLTRSSGDRVIDVVTHTYEDCALAGVSAPEVRFVCESAVERQLREGLSDPREWVTTRERYEHDGYGNRVRVARLGVVGMGEDGSSACAACGERPSDVFGAPCDASCRGDERYEETTFVDPVSGTGGLWMLSRPVSQVRYGVEGGEVAEEQTLYDGLPSGRLALGLPTTVRARVDAARMIDRARTRYDEHGNPVEVRDANGHARRFRYDADGLLPVAESIVFDDRAAAYELEMTVEHGSPIEQPVRSVDWHLAAGAARARDERSTLYAYDAFGRLVAIARPGDSLSAPTEEYAYELAAPVSRIVRRARTTSGGPLDVEEAQCFDGRGRARQTRTAIEPGRWQVSGLSVLDAQGHAARELQPYASSSGACDRSAPSGVLATEQRFDATGRMVRAIVPDANERGAASERRTEHRPLSIASYDEEDSDPSSAHADTPMTVVRDGLDRIVRIERRLAGVAPLATEVRYDALGNLRGYVDPQGIEKVQEHDRLGRVVRVADADSGETRLEWDDAGNLVARTDAREVTTRFQHDEGNRILARWDEASPMRSRTTWSYDAPARCAAERCRFVEGRLAAVDYPIDGGIGSDAFGYDPRGRLVHSARELDGHRFEIGTVYDNLDRAIGRRFPFGRALDLELDGAGRLRSVPGYVEELDYDARGDLTGFSLGNGARTRYGYDAIRRLSTLRTELASGALAQDYRYARDRVGNILSIGDGARDDGTPSQAAEHAYDALYRLTSSRLDPGRAAEETLSVAYDEADNILSMVSSLGASSAGHVGDYAYDPARPHAVVQAGELAYEHDAAGQVVLRGMDSYRWDHLGRLSEARRGVEALASFAYGPDGERVRKIEGDSTTYYVAPDYEVRDGVASIYVRLGDRRVARVAAPDWQAEMAPDLAPARMSGGALDPEGDGRIAASDAWIAEALRQGVLTGADVPGQSTGAVLAAVTQRLVTDPPPVVTYFHHDHLGSVPAITDAGGRVVNRSSRTPYGGLRYALSESSIAADYTGHERDEGTGLHFAGARYLDARVGRWTAPDPAFERVDGMLEHHADAIGRYGYGHSNPVNSVDATGNIAETVLDVASAAAGIHSISQWNERTTISAKILDVAALAADVTAAAVPFIPGGVSLAVRAGRTANTIQKSVSNAQIGLAVAEGRYEDAAAQAVGRGVGAASGYSGLRRAAGSVARDGGLTRAAPAIGAGAEAIASAAVGAGLQRGADLLGGAAREQLAEGPASPQSTPSALGELEALNPAAVSDAP